ncbi:bifunctional DNA-formamidopyrimidine glycosylase/DNA-(apurinic or apyrimidinic site) lyase [Novosphingobium terrae]|uniref:bifunctional DNA-formamidopyrimidine glycosylase/DNA-(apurinic or apyrimidinic site) lyase n=1 Tax=Novosphingobium terrae TaxID=2726189 RepID=UPI00197EC9E6|nr:bifunctional DNA-formamidopyrimidine glycosylase/DNA-(apurinic or apyrimidinic site) lyase [Novosphingobium terrae]
MPELPEVETTIRGLTGYLHNRRIERIEVRREGLRRPFPPELVQTLTGARITDLTRRAKYGVLHTDRDVAMVFHLGMSGRWRIEPDALEKHDHLVLHTQAEGPLPAAMLALNDARRFGSVDLVTSTALDLWPAFAALGPEPLGDGLSVAHLAAAFKGRVGPVKLLLLDQGIVAGLGNIYVCEALHRAHISPLRSGGSIKKAELTRLVPAIRDVLSESILAGGSTIRDYAQPNGELGYFAANWRVYGREGEACLAPGCSGTIARVTQGGRSSFWCPVCQR